MKHSIFICVCLIVVMTADCELSHAGDLIEIHEDFSEDPGWEGFQNRMECVDCPQVVQDFGWSSTTHSTGKAGEIGGRVDNSRNQAYYAMPIGKPLTFKDRFSASGKLAVTHLGLRGVGYFGFFNSTRHEWRPWSSMAIRIWEEDMLGQLMVDWMSADWQGQGFDTDIFVPTDGSVVEWSLSYDPDAVIDTTWEHPRLKEYLTDQSGNAANLLDLQLEENLLEKAREDEPELTAEEFRRRLERARDQGLVEFFQRHGQHRWWLTSNHEDYQGKITFKVGDRRPYHEYVEKRIRNAPVALDRFGVFNMQRYGTHIEMYLGDLTVNDEPIDLSQDPHWEGKSNRVTYTEPDFQSMQNFGYSQTHWAGKSPGEIGGLFWRTEPPDPNFAYYGADIGELSLDDEISFSGTINFVTGMTDAAAFFGYFNSVDQTKPNLEGADAGFPVPNLLGVAISDSTSVGYYWTGVVSSEDGHSQSARGDVFTPTRQVRRFSFAYDPAGGSGSGEVVMTLDGETFSFELTPEIRKAGIKLNRFGLMNVRRGGNSVELYLDDLTYAAGRTETGDFPKYDQETVRVPYPTKSAGRRY